MPVVRCGDQHNLQVPLFEHLPVIAVGAGLLLRGLTRRHHVRGLGQHAFVYVAQRDHFDRGDLKEAEEVALAVPTGADEPNALLLVGELGSVSRESGESQSCSGPGLEEGSAVHTRLCRLKSVRRQAFRAAHLGFAILDLRFAIGTHHL
jgi:hypothetical protein